MGRATVYCEQCGELIPEVDFLSEKAVTVQNKHYCRRCKAAVAHLLAADPPPSPPRRSSGTLPVSRRSSGILPAVPGRQAPGKSTPGRRKRSSGILPAVRTQGSPGGVAGRSSSGVRGRVRAPLSQDEGLSDLPRETRRHRRPKPSNTKWIAIGVGGGIALIAIIGFLLHKSAKDREATELAARNADGASAVQEIRDHLGANPADFSGALRMLGEREVRFQNTLSDADARALRTDIQKKLEVQNWQNEQRDRFGRLKEDTPRDPEGLVGKLETLRREVGDRMPQDFSDEIRKEIDRVRRFGIQSEMQRLKEVLASEPRAYDKVIEGLSDLHMREDVPADMKEEVLSEIDKVRKQRDDDAAAAYEKLERDVVELLGQHLFDQARRRVEEFPEEFNNTPSSRSITDLKRRIHEEETTYKNSRVPKPPDHGDTATPPRDTDGFVSLYDGRGLTGWLLIGDVEVEHQGGVLVVRHKDPTPAQADAGGSIQYSEFLYSSALQDWAEYDFEFDILIEKVEFGIMVRWIRGKSPAWHSRMGPVAGHDLGTWIHFRIEVRENQVNVKERGKTQSHSVKAESDPTGGVSFAIPSGGVIQLRDLKAKRIR